MIPLTKIDVAESTIEGSLSFNHEISETVTLATKVCRDMNLDLRILLTKRSLSTGRRLICVKVSLDS